MFLLCRYITNNSKLCRHSDLSVINSTDPGIGPHHSSGELMKSVNV